MAVDAWSDVCLGDIADLTVGHVGSMVNEYVTLGIPFLRSLNVDQFRINKNDLKYITPEFNSKLNKSRLRPGDLVIVRTGKPGACAVIPDWLQKSNCSDLVIVKPHLTVDRQFLMYYINSISVQHVAANLVGAVQQHFNVSSAKKIPIRLPSLVEQHEIAQILTSLDDKIDINNQMNKTLEQIAQTLFKHWFIDFEFPDEKGNPYRSSGGKMVDSELGEIPEGWEIKKISDYLNTISKTYPLKTVSEVIFLNTGDIQNGKVLHSNKSTVKTLPGQAKKSIQKDDILYSEIRPENKRFAYVFFDGKEHVVSTKLMVLRPIADIDSKFLYFILTQQNTIDFLQMMAESRSGTFPQITFNVISQVEFCGPKDNKIIHIFSKSILAPIMQERYLKDEENIQLSNIRDTLLPKLMSGKIRVQI